MKALQSKKQNIKLVKGEFSVNTAYTQERTGNYELRDKIAAKWDNFSGFVEGCGNCCHEFYFDSNKQTFAFITDYPNDATLIPLYRIISPALLLYRLMATFFCSPKCEDGYKMIWHYNLKHKETGKAVSFSEWKGAAGFWVTDHTSTKLSNEFKKDLIELVNYLISNECAHPYDNLVAGSVA